MKKPFLFALLVSAPLLLLQFASCSSSPGQKPVPADTTKTAGNPTFLLLSDIHLNTFDSTCDYGDDTGIQLWKNFLAKADVVLAGPHAPSFILYTGDLPAHYDCSSGCYLPPDQRASHNANLRAILEGLRMLSEKHHKPLFYLPGNNDALAGDYYSFADEKQQTPLTLAPDPADPFPALNVRHDGKAPCMIADPHPLMGYYSAEPVDGLRLIALNTIIFSPKFTTVDGSTPDSDRVQELNWLALQLKEAKAKNEKVYIAMHIPPGVDAYSGKSMWADTTLGDRFLSLTAQYRNNISGILYGHTHMDEFRRLYDRNGVMTEAAISCPGVTPQHDNNPGFKVVAYDASDKELLDFTTYYTTPAGATWGNNSYTFYAAFDISEKKTIYEVLNATPFQALADGMNTMFMVKHGMPSYNTARGIDVKFGQ